MPRVTSLDWRRLDEIVTVNGAAPDKDKVTLHSIFKDEIFFCAPFFDHYRKLGVEQFIIFDDGSADGTREFLGAQNDCVVLASDFAFEDIVRWEAQPSKWIDTRFKIFLLSAIPRFFLGESYSLHVDADEFLLLPPAESSVGMVIEHLSLSRRHSIVSSLIDFYPKLYSDLASDYMPSTTEEMFCTYPWFDAQPVVVLSADGRPKAVRASKLRNEVVAAGLSLERSLHKKLLERLRGRARPTRLSFKTSIVYHTPQNHYVNEHESAFAGSASKMLAAAHFVFTSNSAQKARKISSSAGRRGRKKKYETLLKMIEKGLSERRSLRAASSARYECAQQLLDVGLMKW